MEFARPIWDMLEVDSSLDWSTDLDFEATWKDDELSSPLLIYLSRSLQLFRGRVVRDWRVKG